MPDRSPDPVIATLESGTTDRTRLRDLVTAALYGQERREWEAAHPGRDPVDFVSTWTPGHVERARRYADMMLDADARSVRRADLTISAWLARIAASAVAGVLMLVVLAVVGLCLLRVAGVDGVSFLAQACSSGTVPRYAGERR